MAGNEWINGYLEAILDTGGTAIYEHKPTAIQGDGHFNPTKYFVEEVVSGVDETDLHRTWIKVVATRNSRERSSRLENMCWRIWHLTRRKKKLEWEESHREANRRWEREQGLRDATEDMLEELSEVDTGQCEETERKELQRNLSNAEVWCDDKKEKKLYLVLVSLHGLVRGENMELGRDSDTGGQVKYVVELARALARMPGVYRVDLFTRQICSPDIDWSYGEPTEMLTTTTTRTEDADTNEVGESSGAYIIRIPFGPRNKYIHKEQLWPYIQEFVDGALSHIVNMSKVLTEQIGKGGGQPVWPYVIHGHYADAGDSVALLSGALNVPMVLTGHSLGRNKLEQLIKQGRQSKEDINSTYKIMRRIEAEELSLDAAELVVTSTKQEIDEQWGLYDGFDVKLEKVLRARGRRGVNCHGRYMPRMVVRKVEDLRQKLRMRGLRCHPMYCRNSTRMHIVPLLASRAQALRYLFVRWRLNVANMYVILGEHGDTDREEMISGTHKTLIMNGLVPKGSEEVHLRDDIVPAENPMVVSIKAEASPDEIANMLKHVSKATP